jgi:putative ABC transport system permease protein
MASYSLETLWYERQRYLPGVLAVAFSALLIALQCGLLLGLFSITSIPIDHTKADVWMGAPEVLSVDLGRPIPESALARMGVQPEVARCEPYLQGFAFWSKRDGGSELCMVIGSRLSPDSLGKIDKLTPEQCGMLAEEGAVIIDESDMKRLGVKRVGDTAEISGHPVRIVGTTRGLPSLAGPYVLCSIPTAKKRLPVQQGETTTYVLGCCRNQQDAAKVVERLNRREKSAFTTRDFSRRTQLHWLLKTKAGIALGYAAALGLLVGAVVTSQTLYAATVASLREFAVLRALGIPRWRIAFMVVSQSFWIGIIGVALALPGAYGLAWAADRLMGVHIVSLPWWLQVSAATVTLGMALVSGLFALRSLRQIEPATLLR